MGRNVFQKCDGTILKTTLTENAQGWNSMWNSGVTTIYDCNNNNLSADNRYFIQGGCKYLIKTDANDEHKYLSLEFCFNAEEKLVIETEVSFEGTVYAVEEMATTAINRFIHDKVNKLIINEGVAKSKFVFSNYALNYMPNLEYVVLPSSTQPLEQTVTYKMYQNDVKVYTNLSKDMIEQWTFREDTSNGGYLKPTIYTVGEWEFINGEPTVIIA